MIWIHSWFSYPNQGSYLTVLMLTLPFLLSVIFMGITCFGSFQTSRIVDHVYGVSVADCYFPERYFMASLFNSSFPI